ncbi:MAG: carboxypeptidase-like regulatory domain-containing protein [Terriglobales bacterium]
MTILERLLRIGSMIRIFAVIILAVLLIGGAVAEKQPEPTSDLSFVVVRATNGKPVRNASVVLHTVDKNGRTEKGGLQLKTDSEGKASIPAMPYGKLRVQVIARGFQTFGEDFEISQPQQEFVIKLNPPQQQYSIYK